MSNLYIEKPNMSTKSIIYNMKYVGLIVCISRRGADSLDRKTSIPCLQQHVQQQISSPNSLSLSRLDPPVEKFQ